MNIHAHGDQLLTVKNRDQIPCYGLRWAGDDLAQISLQLPDQRWLAILPKAATHPVLGQCDLVCGPFEHQGEAMAPEAVRTPITPFRAVDWTAPEAIPPLAEPGRLPAGGGGPGWLKRRIESPQNQIVHIFIWAISLSHSLIRSLLEG